MGTRPIIEKPFDHLTCQFRQLSDEFQNCEDQQRRKELLLAMRVIVDEAEHVVEQYDDGNRDRSLGLL
jgi:hypothetical protein